MSNDKTLKEKVPYNLRLSISNLWEQLGQADNIIFGLLVNLSMALTGVAIVVLFDGIVAFAGAAWAILNLIGIIKWVFGL